MALVILTVGIGLRLIPPLGTKLAIDSVLTTPPNPSHRGWGRYRFPQPDGRGCWPSPAL